MTTSFFTFDSRFISYVKADESMFLSERLQSAYGMFHVTNECITVTHHPQANKNL